MRHLNFNAQSQPERARRSVRDLCRHEGVPRCVGGPLARLSARRLRGRRHGHCVPGCRLRRVSEQSNLGGCCVGGGAALRILGAARDGVAGWPRCILHGGGRSGGGDSREGQPRHAQEPLADARGKSGFRRDKRRREPLGFRRRQRRGGGASARRRGPCALVRVQSATMAADEFHAPIARHDVAGLLPVSRSVAQETLGTFSHDVLRFVGGLLGGRIS
mmetsp:Transcript_5883/g.17057  ORF Transcript_5883/g.17057 Transcript_5883/m.17057 type:complete len:218 (+) Transcript_5883:886-1539(+)